MNKKSTITGDVEQLWSVSVNSALPRGIFLPLLLISLCSFYPCFWSDGMHFPFLAVDFLLAFKKKCVTDSSEWNESAGLCIFYNDRQMMTVA